MPRFDGGASVFTPSGFAPSVFAPSVLGAASATLLSGAGCFFAGAVLVLSSLAIIFPDAGFAACLALMPAKKKPGATLRAFLLPVMEPVAVPIIVPPVVRPAVVSVRSLAGA